MMDKESVTRGCALLAIEFSEDSSSRAHFARCPAAQRRPVNELIEFVTDRKGRDWHHAIEATGIQTELRFTVGNVSKPE